MDCSNGQEQGGKCRCWDLQKTAVWDFRCSSRESWLEQKEPSATLVLWSRTRCSGELYPANSLFSSNLGLFPPTLLVWRIWVQGTVLRVCMRLAAVKASPETPRSPTETAPRQSCSYKINQVFAYKSFPTICTNKSWIRNVQNLVELEIFLWWRFELTHQFQAGSFTHCLQW